MGVGDRLPFNNSRRLRWAAARAASVQICSTLPQSAGGAPNFTGFARRRDPLLCPVAPGCARLRPAAPACARLRPLAPACARLRLVVPSSAVPHHPAPSRTVAPGSFRGAAPSHSSPFAPQRHRTPASSHPSAIAPRPLRSPAPSHPDPFTLLHRHTPDLRVTSSIVATAFPDDISLESPLSYSLTVFAEIAGNRPPANLS